MRRFSRDQRGYVLISAIVLAVLYFALMGLMLVESSRALREAERFRSRVMASTLAENAAELAAEDIVERGGNHIDADDWQGKMTAKMTHNATFDNSPGSFEIEATGKTSGPIPASVDVKVQGEITGKKVTVDYTYHTQ
jgi:Tfp pilus assembly protein PilX